MRLGHYSNRYALLINRNQEVSPLQCRGPLKVGTARAIPQQNTFLQTIGSGAVPWQS